MQEQLSHNSRLRENEKPRPRRGRRLNASPLASVVAYLAPPAVALTMLAVAWEVWTRLADVPVYILPAPLVVIERLTGDIGHFMANGALTLLEALAGFLLGSAVAIAAASLMAQSRFVERSLFPVAVLVKVTPVVALAPLFVIWFGFSPLPIVLVAAIITFFPVLVNAHTGLRSMSPGALDIFRSVHASRSEIFLRLRVPGSLPYLFSAFRIAIPLSVIGAFVGEFFGGNRGLGGLMFVAYHNLDMPTLFSAIFVLAFIGISLTVITSYAERRVLFWHDSFLSS